MDKFINFIKDWCLPVVIAIVLAILLNKFVFFNIEVPTGSMIPAIKEGDRIFVLKNHSAKTLERGDIVVFHNDEVHKDLVKRLIGLPGENIEIKHDGSVYINGDFLEEPYVKNPSNLTGNFTVPEGNYLFFGDNRSGSEDARSWENPYIPYEDIMGEAKFTLYPFNRFGKLK